jgi:hypothetical protein
MLCVHTLDFNADVCGRLWLDLMLSQFRLLYLPAYLA